MQALRYAVVRCQSVQLLRHARWHRSGFASCCWSKRVDLPFCLSLSISLAVDTGRSQFDDNTVFACFVDKHCYELRPVEASPVSDPCPGDLQELHGFDESTGRSAKRLATRIYILGECTIGGVPPGKRQTEEKSAWYLGKTRWWEKHVQLLLSWPSQRRSYRRPSTPLLPFPQAESRDCDARIFTRPAPRLVWSGAASVGWAPFFCRKKSTKKSLNSVTVHL